MKIRMKRIISLGLLMAVLCTGCATAKADDNMEGNLPESSQMADTEIMTVDTTKSMEAVAEPENTEESIQAVAEPESTEESIEAVAEPENTEESEYVNFAIADVTDYVNVRSGPSTDYDIVGKIYDGAVAQILSVAGEEDEWFQIISGNVEGYIKAEFFIHGDAAAEVMEQYVTQYVHVNVDRLNVRAEQSVDSKRIGYLNKDERLKLLSDCGEWIHVQYTDGKEAFVASQYVSVVEEYRYAKTLEEERAEREKQMELEQRVGVSENKVKESITNVAPPSTAYTSNAQLRQAIVNYALQFVGNRYVHGGQSLTTGTDCSGFTMYILKEFGYSISRTPQGQYTGAGRKISYSEIQPGDIICYSSNGGKSCTHVAFYIGDGKIVHAANSKDGVKISSATYDDIYGVRNVID